MSASPRGDAEAARPLVQRVLAPFSVLMIIYVAYFALVYSKIYEYAYWELMNLGTRIIGFEPSAQTFLLYVWAAIVLVFGFCAGVLLAWRVAERGGRGSAIAARAMRRLESLPVLRTVGVPFSAAVLGWAAGFAANAAQVVASGGISLIDIGTRWAQSPILVFLAMAQIFFVPAMIVTARGSKQAAFTVAVFVVSTAALGALGARNIPAKLIVSAFLAAVYAMPAKYLWRLAAVFVVVLVLVMGVVGALSKQGIYGAAASAKSALALTYSDSAGTVSNLDRIVQLSPSTGAYGGRLLRDSILAGVPHVILKGAKPDYANYQIGKLLGGRTYFVINGEHIDRSVSLAPTLLGSVYADTGVPGTAVQMVLLGLLFGYLQTRAWDRRWLVPFLAMFGSYAINGVNVGMFSPHALTAVAFAIAVVAIDAVFPGGAAAVPVPVTEEF